MKKNIYIITGFLLLSITLSLCLNVKAVVSINTDIEFDVGNETYTVNDTTRNFNQIIIDDNYIVFNSTGFNVTSSNDITLLIDYINGSIANAGSDDLVVEFSTDVAADGDSIEFTIDGFKSLKSYYVLRNNTNIANLTSSAGGSITLSDNVWDDNSYEIYEAVSTGGGDFSYGISYGVPSPNNASIDRSLSFIYSISMDSNFGFNWTMECSNGDTNSGINAGNGTKTLSLSGLAYSSTYTVWINSTDNDTDYYRVWFTFTTTAAPPATDPHAVYSTLNGTDFLNEPWNTTLKPFIDLLGNGFYLIPLTFIAMALYMYTRNFVLVSAFIWASGLLLISGSIFTNYPEMALVYGIFTAMGVAGVILGVYFNIRRG